MNVDKARILVVDDEKMNIKVLSGLLRDDYQIVTAQNGKQALDRARSNPPDLILLDIIMPEMDGYETCQRLKADAATRNIPVIFVTIMGATDDETKGLELGAVDFISKPINPAILLARVQMHLALANHRRLLEYEVKERTAELEASQEALREAMQNLLTFEVAPGVVWLQVPEAGLYILCGCPAEIVKHLMRKGFINSATKNGVTYETGPNVILLSDVLVQNGGFANLAEFPVLQMLYRQGMILPNHPNNTGVKPLIIGSPTQVKAQMEYIYRGNYGLVSKEEIMAAGVDEESAEAMMRIKLKFAFGKIHQTSELIDSLEVAEKPVVIRNGVTVERIGFNRFQFAYRGRHAEVDLNLPAGVIYEPPYPLGQHRFKHPYFAVLHTGDGDGWDMNHPSMGSVVMFQGRIYLIDAAPNVLHALTALGIDIGEVEGVFHTHAHDDHFAGLPALIRSDRRLKYFATPLVRSSVAKKFAALMSMPEEKFSQFFELHDLQFDQWNECDGLGVKPIYSPHPLETSLLMFRAMDRDGYQIYAHWADLSSFQVLDNMTGDGPGDVPPSFMAKVKADYLQPSNLKKLDIGGGVIHGMAEDFTHDPSDRLILSHISRKLSIREMEIGSEASFGAIDVLIPGTQDYLRQRAFRCLVVLFPDVDKNQIYMLVNSPLMKHNPGTIIRRPEEQAIHVDMILSGTVAYLESDVDVHHHLSFGSIIGVNQLFEENKNVPRGTYRAVSHCSVICFSVPFLKSFLINNDLFGYMKDTVNLVNFLMRTWLFGEQTTFFLLNCVARDMQSWIVPNDGEIERGTEAILWLVGEGCAYLIDDQGKVLEELGFGGFFGEETFLSERPTRWRYKAKTGTELYRLPMDHLLEIPIVHWKMLEVYKKRANIVARNSGQSDENSAAT